MEANNILQGFIQKLPQTINNPQHEEQYIKELKTNSEVWQIFQNAYRNWKIENKSEITQKSKLLTAIKKSINE